MKLKKAAAMVLVAVVAPAMAAAQGISDRGQSGSAQSQRNAYAVITQSIVKGTENALAYPEMKKMTKKHGPSSLAHWCASEAPKDAMETCVYLAVEESSRPYMAWEVGTGFSDRDMRQRATWAAGLGALAYVSHDFYRYIGERLSTKPFSSMADAKASIETHARKYFAQHAKPAFRQGWQDMSTAPTSLNMANSSEPVEANFGGYRLAAGPSGVSLSQYGVTLFDSKAGVIAGTQYTFTIEQNRNWKAQESSSAKPKSSAEEKRKIQGLMGG